MKILVVCRWHRTHAAAFIMEQVDALRALEHDVEYCTADKGGMMGYVDLYRKIRKAIKTWRPDIIHAHYGICGFVAGLAISPFRPFRHLANCPQLVTTYPGSDINSKYIRHISRLCMHMSAYNLFMSKRQIEKVKDLASPSKTMILRYGIMLDLFQPMDRLEARKLFANVKPDEVKWNDKDKYVLFSSKYNRPVKDPELAKSVIEYANQQVPYTIHLLPLTGGYTKEEMVWLMNAVDAGLITSKTEGSPQFTKEMMACGTPIVSVDVGDVREQFVIKGSTETLSGYFVSNSREPKEIAFLVKQAIKHGKTNGPTQVKSLALDVKQIAYQLEKIYNTLLVRNK